MAWQKYPVPCDCGTVREVLAGDAGSSFACDCGKTVDVPSLVKLKASVGQSTVSADFELDQMIGSNALPVEDTCGVCGLRTMNKAFVEVMCDREEEKKGIEKQAALGGFFGWAIGWFLAYLRKRGQPGKAIGQNLRCHLPIRVCEGCAAGRWTVKLTRTVLDRTPLYARLLDKYPDAEVGTPG